MRLFYFAYVMMLFPIIAVPASAAELSDTKPSTGTFFEFELRGSHTQLDGFALRDEDYNFFLARQASVRAGTRSSNGLHLQIDGNYELSSQKSKDAYAVGLSLIGHAGYDYGPGLAAAFLGVMLTDQDNNSTDTSHRYVVGAEAQHDLSDNILVFGQAGYLSGNEGTDARGKDSIRDAGFINGGVSLYLTDNTKLSASGLYMSGIMDLAEEYAQVRSLNFEMEHQLGDSGHSLFAGYRYSDYFQDEDGGETLYERKYSLGYKWRFGAGSQSLKSANRDGALSNLPNFMWIVGQTGGPLE